MDTKAQPAGSKQLHIDLSGAAGGITLVDCLYDIDFSNIAVPDFSPADAVTATTAPVSKTVPNEKAQSKNSEAKNGNESNVNPAKKSPAVTVLLVAGLVICVSVLVYAAANIGYTFYLNLNQRTVDTEANMLFDAAMLPVSDVVAAPVAEDGFTPDEIPEESEWERERRLLEEAEARGRIIYADLLEINPDFLGMIEIPGVIERQPYVMSKDNEEYLTRNFQGQRTGYGTVFLNAGNDRLMMDNHSIFFGHYNAYNSGMFTKLMEYKNAETVEVSPVVILDGLIGKSIWLIFAAHVIEAERLWMYSYNDADEYAGFLQLILDQSMYDTGVDVDVTDRIITLSVCDYTYDDSRFLVHARRLRPDEQIPVSVISNRE